MSRVRELLTSIFLITASSVSLILISTSAFAQGAAPAGPPAYMQFLPLVVIVGVMYFLVIRPQAKKQRDHQSFVANLKRGEEVLTSSGILGRIEGLTDLYVTLEIAPSVRIRVLRSQIASNVPTVSATTEVKA